MIDEEKTFEKYGYVSTDLTDGSHKLVVVICTWCGETFDRMNAYSSGNRFCSRECQNKYISKYRVGENSARWSGGDVECVCEMCGKRFSIMKSHAKTARFCSRECNGKWHSKEFVGEKSSNWAGGKHVRVCNCCGKEFDCYPSSGQRFCSRKCYFSVMSGENSPQWRGGKLLRACEHCGKEFLVYNSRDKQMFCSRECAGAEKSVTQVGENSPNWRGGASFEPYCEKFNDSFKESIRVKYDGVCFICGSNNSTSKRKLSVHHVNYEKSCLCDDVECSFVPLCPRCHSRTNFNRFFWERTIMYALEFYDDYYDWHVPKPLLCLNI